ncbi:phospholipase D-like domain-containing protein [Psychrobacter lutiphocae]|uniref:phospholipase D-like domain-containing protein n=1 Tax=Psychrobacter lutiphocae TaxID=540500 RepID=UPI000364B522|nr:phospholipase D-like domain-containing protein [Psychrobacter lutiphocae]
MMLVGDDMVRQAETNEAAITAGNTITFVADSGMILTSSVAMPILSDGWQAFSLFVQNISAGGWAWMGVAVHLLLTIFMIVRILSTQRNTGIAIAWLVLLFAIPFVSIIAYLLVGEPFLGKSYKSRNAQAQRMLKGLAKHEAIQLAKVDDTLPERYQGVSRIGTYDTGFGVYDEHQMQLLTSADIMFDTLIKDINQAHSLIVMEFYIIYPKGRVQQVFQALIAAAKRGVECQILADSVGSFSFFSDAWHTRLITAGIIIHQSLPVGLFKTLFKRTDLRNHRKIVVIDDDIGYTGSFNLVDPEFFKQDKDVGQWIDLMMRIKSDKSVSVVTALTAVSVTDIGAESSRNLKLLGKRIEAIINTYTRKLYHPKPAINDVNDKATGYLARQISSFHLSSEYGREFKANNQTLTLTPDPEQVVGEKTTESQSPQALQALKEQALDYMRPLANLKPVSNVLAQLIPSAPRITEHVIYHTLLTIFHRADHGIQITTPYFVPDEALLAALTTAAKRGVEVTLILPKKVDSFLVQHASQSSYSILMEAGVKIALFKGGLLHAKTVVVDDDYCLFGTVNMDMRSFYLNMEVSLALYSSQIVEQVKACQQAYLTQCEMLDLVRWNTRPRYKQLFDSGIRLFSPLL